MTARVFGTFGVPLHFHMIFGEGGPFRGQKSDGVKFFL